MTNISKSKLRNLPYNSRLTLALKQDDFFEEVQHLFNDYPTYDHTIAQSQLLDRCKNINTLLRCFTIKNINLSQLIQYISDTILEEQMPSLTISDIAVNLTKYRQHPSFKEYVLIIDSLLKLHNEEKIKKKHNLDNLYRIRIFYSTMKSEPIDYVAEKLLCDMGYDEVINFLQQHLGRVNDSQIKQQIIDAINIRDIII